ncbi:DUF5947 family protein [Methylocystis sp. 9N]|uniref:DUF5947 family protein n=1 Tax=Methylocystis borbori TaxID=3118750 RepID=A0ABU7XHZ1_9HYPH
MERTRPGNWASKLRRFVVAEREEHCDFCSKAIAPRHSHLIERATGKFFCACPQCALVLGTGDRFVALVVRTHALTDFNLTDAEWDDFRIPIDLAFVFHSTPAQGPVAIYPGPAGATQSQLGVAAWTRVVAAHPMLADLDPDVEALLVNRMNGAREYYRVSIDRCYSLIGLIRMHWRGLSGGAEVWDAVHDYFTKLRDEIAPGDMVHG